jgi:GAF domain-containing protein
LANPLVVGELGLGFYAAAPLTTHDGHNLGTFCIIDQKPRYLTDAQKLMLQDMAAIVMDEIELRLAVRTAIGENAQRTAELRKFREAVAS